MYKNNKIKSAGFSLIEITIVLFILGLIIAGTITPLAVSIDQSRRVETEERIENIQDAILGFTLSNGRLPCPDCPTGTSVAGCAGLEDDGLADFDGNQCIVSATGIATGNIPWATLGINGLDSWGRFIQYAVQAEYADTTGDTVAPLRITACNNTATTNSFSLCSQASITINDSGTTCAGTANTIAQFIPYVVFSHGQDLNGPAGGTASCNETENTNGDGTFVFRGLTQNNTLFLDDLIFWGSPFIINSQMVKAELLP